MERAASTRSSTRGESRAPSHGARATGRRRCRRAGPVPVTIPPTAERLPRAAAHHLVRPLHRPGEIEGARALTDPVISDRCSPAPLPGPHRLHPGPVSVTELPPLDAVVVSHDHYGHPDAPTVRALAHPRTAPFVVPLGVGAPGTLERPDDPHRGTRHSARGEQLVATPRMRPAPIRDATTWTPRRTSAARSADHARGSFRSSSPSSPGPSGFRSGFSTPAAGAMRPL
ncbi:MBL fold metallo-hydrolase [Streptomyces sp. NPDC007904]|uniref:MBL fold metallo-hydrolase n=1 Tax=Streptomyces sp. NPDC007904 TaxID=3364787 RepID=UPI0036E0B7DC